MHCVWCWPTVCTLAQYQTYNGRVSRVCWVPCDKHRLRYSHEAVTEVTISETARHRDKSEPHEAPTCPDVWLPEASSVGFIIRVNFQNSICVRLQYCLLAQQSRVMEQWKKSNFYLQAQNQLGLIHRSHSTRCEFFLLLPQCLLDYRRDYSQGKTLSPRPLGQTWLKLSTASFF